LAVFLIEFRWHGPSVSRARGEPISICGRRYGHRSAGKSV